MNNININELYEMASNFVSRIDARGFTPQPCAYELVVPGEGGGVFSAEINNNRIALERRPRPDAVCSISASADVLAAMLSGRLKPMQAFMTGKIKVRGDISSVMRFASLFR